MKIINKTQNRQYMNQEKYAIRAVVVGLCAHGLAVVRALGRNGIKVYAFESDLSLPGVVSRWAEVWPAQNINGPELFDDLVAFAQKMNFINKPVLLFINDKMVNSMSSFSNELSQFFRLSWASNIKHIHTLLYKDQLAEYCQKNGFKHPDHMIIRKIDDTISIWEKMKGPLIVKPCQPLSSFKAIQITSQEQFLRIVKKFRKDLPLIVQRWIPGGHQDILVANFYLSEGEPLSIFTGKKLRSYPPLVGGASAVQQIYDQQISDEALRFFKPLKITGPASLEFKQDADRNRWIIEPTIGRTDYFVGVCINSGINLPMVEYCHQAGYPIVEEINSWPSIWVDTDRDKKGLFSIPIWWLRCKLKVRFCFPFLSLTDPLPFLKACFIEIIREFKRLKRKFKKLELR